MTEDQYEQLYLALARRCNDERLEPVDLAAEAVETRWPLCLDVLRWSENRGATEQADLEAWLVSNRGGIGREGIYPLIEYFARMALAADIEVKAEHLREEEEKAAQKLQAALEFVRLENLKGFGPLLHVRVKDARALLEWVRQNACHSGHEDFTAVREDMGPDGELFTPRDAADWNDLYESCPGYCKEWFDAEVWQAFGYDAEHYSDGAASPGPLFVD